MKHLMTLLAVVVCIILLPSHLLVRSDGIPPIQSILLNNNPYGAKCLDGSPPGFYFRQGTGSGSNSWIFHLQGGGWCTSINDCLGRSQTSLGSSNFWRQSTDPDFDAFVQGYANFTSILSPSPSENPRFSNWNAVYMLYCDGASFTGEIMEAVPANATTSLFFHGYFIFSAVINELQASHSLNLSSEVLLTGCSAGAVAVPLLCDRMAALLPGTVKVKCLMDGGYFLDAAQPTFPYRNKWRSIAKNVKELQHAHYLDACMKAKGARNAWSCFFPQYGIPYLAHPIMVVNSDADVVAFLIGGYDVSLENLYACIDYVKGKRSGLPPRQCTWRVRQGIRKNMKRLTESVSNILAVRPSDGGFIYPQVAHCTIILPQWNIWMANGQSLPDAVTAWYNK